MTWTRTRLEAQIADDLDRSDLSTQVSDAVDTALRVYRMDRFTFNEAYKVTATLSASVDNIDLSSLSVRFRKIDRLRLRRNATDYMDLIRREYSYIMERQEWVVAALPTEYCVYNNAIHFDCQSDQTYTLLLDGIKDLSVSASSTASDSSAWFNDAKELIRHRAKAELYAHTLKDMELAAAAKAAERDALNTLKGEAHEQIATGFVTPTEF